MAQADLGKVRLTDAELSDKIIQVNGGVRLGKDADGKPGYVVTDAETGADTVVPFKNGGGENNSDLGGIVGFGNNTQINYLGGLSTFYYTYFKNPVKVSEIQSIHVNINVNGWEIIRCTSGITATRSGKLILYVGKDGVFKNILTPVDNFISSNAGTALSLNKEYNFMEGDMNYNEYTDLFGIGVSFLQGSSGSGSYMATKFNGYSEAMNCLEYVITLK